MASRPCGSSARGEQVRYNASVIRIAPSILSADFAALADEIARVEAGHPDQLHVDVMDGRFVPNLTIGPVVVEAIRKRTQLPLDVHLMIVEPDRYVGDFRSAGATMITVHAEACPHLQRTLAQIRELGARAGVALNPGTHPSVLEYVLDDLDLVLVMSVNPGFGGQRFIPNAYAKIRHVRSLLDRHQADVSVDGGVKLDNVRPLVEHGASMLVAGSAIFGAADPAAAVRAMREAAESPRPPRS
jgi:ribulose-phosphate 3-epimerase